MRRGEAQVQVLRIADCCFGTKPMNPRQGPGETFSLQRSAISDMM
jgi:hypothetical protein